MEMDTVISILSVGVLTAFVTGVFSLIVALKNNKRLIEIEKAKQKYSMDSKKYELLFNYSKMLSERFKEFEFDGKADATMGCLKNIFGLLLHKFEFIKKEHEKHSFLFEESDNEDIEIQMLQISGCVDEFIDKFKNSESGEGIEGYIDKIGLSIIDFSDNYLKLINEKISNLLNVN